MKKTIIALTGGLLLAAGACTDNPAAPSVDRVVAGGPATLQTLLTGFNAQMRGNSANPASGAASFTEYGAYMARDVIRPDPNDSRFITEFLLIPPDPSDFVGGSQFAGYYATIRAGQTILTTAAYKALSAADQAATRGFVRTVMANAYIHVIEIRDQHGVVIQPADPTILGPLKTKASGMTIVAALLDSAYTDFATASATVPFKLPPGYTLHGDYTLVSNLKEFNRGLRGQLEIMRILDPTPQGSASAAKGFLDLALADATVPDQAYLNKGPYADFNNAAPESYANPLASDPKVLLTDNFVNQATAGDTRLSLISKVAQQTSNGYGGQYQSKINTDPAYVNAPLAYLRNAELYLLRAQAEIELGQLAAATADINVVHTVEGGLAPYGVFATKQAAIDAVLYEFRYSFVFQGWQHINALREYNMFNAAYISQSGIPSPGPSLDPLTSSLPIPQNEKNARGGNVTPVP